MEATMLLELVQTFFILFFFLGVELARAVLWVARTIDEPDRDGPLLSAVFGLLIHFLAVVPRPVWTLAMYVGWVVWTPVRVVLLVWGIGRESLKRSPRAVTQWYINTRVRRVKLLRPRKGQDDE